MPKMFYRIVYVSFLVFVYVRLSLNAMQSKWSSCCLQSFLENLSSGSKIFRSALAPKSTSVFNPVPQDILCLLDLLEADEKIWECVDLQKLDVRCIPIHASKKFH